MLKNITYFPTFKDFDKPVQDILNDDFDTKYLLKIKTPGPKFAVFNTQIQFDDKTSNLIPKVSVKYTHPSGFTLDKLEAMNNKVLVESSFSDVAPGLKLEFKGDNVRKDFDLGFTYKHPLVTLTGEADVQKQSFAKLSANSGNGPITVGGSIDFKLEKKKLHEYSCSLGGGYTIPRQVFLGVRTEKKFTENSVLFKYFASPELTLGGKISHNNKNIQGSIVGVYRCNPNTIMKVKVNHLGTLNVSVKHTAETKFNVVGTASIPKTVEHVDLGLIANIG